MTQLVTSRELKKGNRSFIKFQLQREECLETEDKNWKAKFRKPSLIFHGLSREEMLLKWSTLDKLPPSSQRLGDSVKSPNLLHLKNYKTGTGVLSNLSFEGKNI